MGCTASKTPNTSSARAKEAPLKDGFQPVAIQPGPPIALPRTSSIDGEESTGAASGFPTGSSHNEAALLDAREEEAAALAELQRIQSDLNDDINENERELLEFVQQSSPAQIRRAQEEKELLDFMSKPTPQIVGASQSVIQDEEEHAFARELEEQLARDHETAKAFGVSEATRRESTNEQSDAKKPKNPNTTSFAKSRDSGIDESGRAIESDNQSVSMKEATELDNERLAEEADAALLESERLANEASAWLEAEQLEKEKESIRLESERSALEEETARKEAERLAKEETARLEAEQIAREQEAARLKAEFSAQEQEAAHAEMERLAKEEAHLEAERLAFEEEAARIEAERFAKEESGRLAGEEATQQETDRIAVEEAARLEAERMVQEEVAARLEAARAEAEMIAKQEEAARLEAECLAAEEAARLQTERIAREQDEAARLQAAERLAQEQEAARLEAERFEREEAERLVKENAARLEAERLAKEEAERIAQEEEAARIEAERLAKEETERMETERLAGEEAARIEAERLAKEEAARLEAERLALEQEAARIEAERLAKEESERAAREEDARLEDERIAFEKEAARLEAERLAQEEAARLETERLAQEQEAARIEAERLAREEEVARLDAERIEAARIAREQEAARLEAERIEAARIAREQEAARLQAERLAQEEQEAARIAEAERANKEEEAARMESLRLAKEEEEEERERLALAGVVASPLPIPSLVEQKSNNPSEPFDSVAGAAGGSADVGFAIALYSFVPDDYDREIELQKGDLVEVLHIPDSEWCYGRTDDGREGLFPSNYVQYVNKSESEQEEDDVKEATQVVDDEATSKEQIDSSTNPFGEQLEEEPEEIKLIDSSTNPFGEQLEEEQEEIKFEDQILADFAGSKTNAGNLSKEAESNHETSKDHLLEFETEREQKQNSAEIPQKATSSQEFNNKSEKRSQLEAFYTEADEPMLREKEKQKKEREEKEQRQRQMIEEAEEAERLRIKAEVETYERELEELIDPEATAAVEEDEAAIHAAEMARKDAELKEKFEKERIRKQDLEEITRANELERKMIEASEAIMKGHEMIEANNAQGAMAVFQQAFQEAQALQDMKLVAQANAGKAAACRISSDPSLKKQAAQLFEGAASMFELINEPALMLDSIREASESYLLVGQKEEAIKCLERFDARTTKSGGQPQFTKRIADLKAAKPSGKKGWFFG